VEKDAYEVKALSPHDRFVIALHSPDGVGEIGLCLCPAEKRARKFAQRTPMPPERTPALFLRAKEAVQVRMQEIQT
jgi:hypothetical protein